MESKRKECKTCEHNMEGVCKVCQNTDAIQFDKDCPSYVCRYHVLHGIRISHRISKEELSGLHRTREDFLKDVFIKHVAYYLWDYYPEEIKEKDLGDTVEFYIDFGVINKEEVGKKERILRELAMLDIKELEMIIAEHGWFNQKNY